MNTCIYILIDPRNNQVRYVGKSNDPKKRLQSHYHAYKPTKKFYWLHKLRDLGLEPELIIVDIVPMAEWALWETYWYDQMRAWGFDLYNTDLPGKGGDYRTMEERRKIGSKKKGHSFVELYGEKRAKEIVEKMNASKAKQSSEKKQAITEKRLATIEARGLKEQIREKISKSRTGQKVSEETGAKISSGIRNSEKYKQAMQERDSNGTNNSRYAGKIYQYTKDKTVLIKEWEGLHELKDTEYSVGNVSSCCNGKLKQYKGFFWTREKVQES